MRNSSTPKACYISTQKKEIRFTTFKIQENNLHTEQYSKSSNICTYIQSQIYALSLNFLLLIRMNYDDNDKNKGSMIQQSHSQ